MLLDYLIELKDKIFNKKELEHLDYINKRDLVIYDLTRTWTDEEILSFNLEHNMFCDNRTQSQIKNYILNMNRYKYFNDDDYNYFKNLIREEGSVKKLIK